MAAMTLVACGEEVTGPVDRNPSPAVASVEVEPNVADLDPGGTVQLTATALTAAGIPLSQRNVTWSSNNVGVATVTSDGLVAATRSGTAKIQARVEDRWGEATITVSEVVITTPSLTQLSPATIPVRSPVVTIVLTGSSFLNGAVVLLNGTARTAQWISSTELRLTLGPSQLLTEDTVQVAVRNPDGGETRMLPFVIGPPAVNRVAVSQSSVTVSVGNQVQLTATAYDIDDTVLIGRTFSWSSVSPGTASVDETGLVTGQRVGETAIIVESEGHSVFVPVSVLTPVGYVVVRPNPAAVLVGLGVQLEAVTLASNGIELTGRPITWSSEDTGIASVDTAGQVNGVSKGTTRIFAESEGKSAWSVVEVRQYASGPVQPYEFRGAVGSIVLPPVDTTTWVGQDGVGHDASMFIAGGLLSLNGQNSTYEQTFELDVVVNGMGVVDRVTWTDEGTYWYDFISGGITLVSSSTDITFTATAGGQGELHVKQTIGIAPNLTYSWVIK